MMHRPWSSIVEVPYCFSRSNVKFQGHTALKIVKFYRNWAFLDSNSSLNSLMVMKCCTKLETAKERCPIVFQSHPSNFKVTRDKTSPLLTRIGRFRTIGRSQLSNPSDLPCFYSVSGWHGFGSVTQVCFGISVSNFMCMSFVAVGRSLTIVSYVAFKMAALWFWTMPPSLMERGYPSRSLIYIF